MKWTKEKPKEPGWYWVSFEHQGKWQKPQMIELIIFNGEMCEVTCTQDGGDYDPINLFWPNEYLIYGPLSPPKLP